MPRILKRYALHGLMVVPLFLYLLAFTGLPVLSCVVLSLTDEATYGFPSWNNYRTLFSVGQFSLALRNTLWLTGLGVSLEVLVGLGTAIVLHRLVWGRGFVRTIVLTASEDEQDYVETVRRGARGIVLKQAASERLLEGIRKVHRGEIWIDQRVAAEVMKAMTRPGPPAPAGEKVQLTPRENEIVTLVTQGYRNKEIAEKLSISEQTVKNHLQNIYDKLGVSDRLELALYALHHRLVPPA